MCVCLLLLKSRPTLCPNQQPSSSFPCFIAEIKRLSNWHIGSKHWSFVRHCFLCLTNVVFMRKLICCVNSAWIFFAIASLSSLLQLSVFKLHYLLGIIVGKHQCATAAVENMFCQYLITLSLYLVKTCMTFVYIFIPKIVNHAYTNCNRAGKKGETDRTSCCWFVVDVIRKLWIHKMLKRSQFQPDNKSLGLVIAVLFSFVWKLNCVESAVKVQPTNHESCT